MTAIRGYGGMPGLVLVCDRCGDSDDAPPVGRDPDAVGWEGPRGALGPHFCPSCASSAGRPETSPARR
jgi:hypothetical protein